MLFFCYCAVQDQIFVISSVVAKKITYKCSKEIYECIDMHYILQCLIHFYYIDTSVLLENIPLVKFIKLHLGHEWFIFHNLTHEFIDDVFR